MSTRIQTSIWAFARKERRGTLFLLIMILLLAAIPFLLPFIYTGSIAGQVNIDSSLAQLQVQKDSAQTKRKYKPSYDEEDRRPYDHPSSFSYTSYKPKGELFYFDPNSIDEAGWKKLGLRDKTVAIIMNYRNKGGRFKEPEDIKKIWGLFPDEAERIIPFVRIETKDESLSQQSFENTVPAGRAAYSPKKYSTISINAADSNALMTMPGIGAKLSARIINFRDKLGGFYSVEQIGETFGLPDSTFQKIKPYLQVDGSITKMNINTATLEDLKAHPYIRYHLANAIVQYRKQHGDFKQVEDLRKIMIMNDDIMKKLSPYLDIQ